MGSIIIISHVYCLLKSSQCVRTKCSLFAGGTYEGQLCEVGSGKPVGVNSTTQLSVKDSPQGEDAESKF